MDYEDRIEKDSEGRVIYESRKDGFEEHTTYYDNGKVATIETKYPNGIVEHERYAID